MNLKESTLEVLKKYVPQEFLEKREHYFEIMDKTREVFPSDNWNSFIESLVPINLDARQVFVDNNSYNNPQYFQRYNNIMKNKIYKGETYYEILQRFNENPIFPTQSIQRCRYDTVQEALNILKYIDIDKPFTMLDIGGGYGRLAEYFLKYPNCTYYMSDTFTFSNIMSEWYLSHVVDEKQIKFLDDNTFKRLNFIPTNQIESCMKNTQFNFVINIHSMDEMNIPTISKFLSIINNNNVSYVYLKNHFTTYALPGFGNSDRINWEYLIPKNWQLLESNYCVEEEGFGTIKGYEKIFKIEL